MRPGVRRSCPASRATGRHEVGFFHSLAGDGRPLLAVAALALIACGGFALWLGATGEFLPHDEAWLGMSRQQLCAVYGCRIVHFMIHDRVSLGGVIVAIGVLYLWLLEFPLKAREGWAWWVLLASGGTGFASFLTWLGHGYLDTWHAMATLVLLLPFAGGMWRTREIRRHLTPRPPLRFATRPERGRVLLVLAAVGMMTAGATITLVGATLVFVPQDLEFMRLSRPELAALNARLIPLIAHDRAGFGGALASFGVAMMGAVLYGGPSRALSQALACAGFSGFASAIGIHPAIGYTSATHLAPAVAGCVLYVSGLVLAWPARAHPSPASSLPRSSLRQRRSLRDREGVS
jgi:hypothetical protein